ncbi:MAG TPA: carboxypeptidase-like regulatory domain-containing protein, partial [Blastocatellia bacterium]|nr:carboxypeptidase-like regulatory domain-containing protein [Blastocatellia bacterium]
MNKSKALIIFVFIGLVFAAQVMVSAAGGSISGTVRDPNGAVVVGAQVTVTNATTNESGNATTDKAGRYKIDNLAPGNYLVTVKQNGFKQFSVSIAVVDGKTATADVKLELEATKAEVNVAGGKVSKSANSDPNYRRLREEGTNSRSRSSDNAGAAGAGAPGAGGAFGQSQADKFETYSVSELVLKRDVGTLTFHKGSIGFLPPVLNKVAKAVFVGEGEFSLTPATQVERNHMRQITNSDSATESFTKVVFYFSDATYDEVKSKAQPGGTDAGMTDVINDFNKRVRYNLESLENIDGEMLIDLYNPRRAGAFNAYINGQKHHDFRFHLRPWGVSKENFESPEEVALLDLDINDPNAGIWYLAHRESEYKDGTASSLEDKHIIHTEHYKIETVIDKGSHLTATCDLKFKALMDGDRVLRFGLLPRLRVSRVVFGDDTETDFIQEDRKRDGTFYVILPEPTVAGKEYKLTMEYRGDQVVQDAG